MPRTAERLLVALAHLPLVVEEVSCVVREAAVPSYPGGLRPTSTVTCAGGGLRGHGENVAWTRAAHERFRDRVAPAVPRGRWSLAAWCAEMAGRTAERYERAALEAAAIDLALRQSGTNLFRLAGVRARPVRYVVSFDRRPDPAEAIRRLAPGSEVKIDADPAWDGAVYDGLREVGCVAIVDFKGTGTADDHERAHRALPAALIEDPQPGATAWSAGLSRRLSCDAPVEVARDVTALAVRPAAVNVKPARMGGVLEALRCIAACEEAGIDTYIGGMFEVDVGRAQLHVLAALFSPDGPNDVAPLGAGDVAPARPPRLAVDDRSPGLAARAGRTPEGT